MLLFPKSEKDLKNEFSKIKQNFCHEHLDIRDFLGDGVYLLKGGDLSASLKISGICDETLTYEELDEKIGSFHKALRGILVGIPAIKLEQNSVVQIHLRNRPIIQSDLNLRKYNSIKNSDLKNFFTQEELYHFKTRRIIKREIVLSIRFIRNTDDESTFSKKIKRIIKRERDDSPYISKLIKDLEVFKHSLNSVVNSLNTDFGIEYMGPEDLISFIQGYVNFKDDPVISNDSKINEQIICDDLEINEEIKLGDKNLHLFYLDQIPSHFLNGQFRIFLDSLPTSSFDITWTLSHGSSKYESHLIAKESWQARKPSNEFITSQYESFRKNTNTINPYGVMSLKLLTYDLSEEDISLVQSASLDYLGARLVKETQLLVHQFKSMLPANCHPLENKLRGGRFKTIRLDNALSFAPFFVGSKITNNFRYYISRSNTLTSFDAFAGSGNKMTAVLAATRSGKSVLTANLILEFMAKNPEGIVRIIDKKSSYQKLSDLVGGSVVEFSQEKLMENPYSPFNLKEWDEDDIDNLYLLISTALVQKNPGILMSATHGEVLKESIKMAFNNHLNNKLNAQKINVTIDPHPTWQDVLAQMPQVCQNLESAGVKGCEKAREDLANWSVNLYPTGQYGFIFSSIEKHQDKGILPFLTYDLDGINDEVLRQIAFMMAFIKISRDLSKLPRKTPKLIIFEELGMLLHGEDNAQKLMDEFIHMVIKTCAKLNAQAIAITNDVKDYSQKPAGQTIWANSSQKFFLPLGDLYDGLKKAWEDKFSIADLQILKSLKKEFYHKRSQCYLISENEISPYKGSFYIPLSPFADALTTTSGPQVDLYQTLKKDLSCIDALIKMSTDHPYGENL